MVNVKEIMFEDNYQGYMVTGDPFYVWKTIAGSQFPDWVKEYLVVSAKKIVNLDNTKKAFPQSVTHSLRLKKLTISQANNYSRDVKLYFCVSGLRKKGNTYDNAIAEAAIKYKVSESTAKRAYDHFLKVQKQIDILDLNSQS